jgi:ABC-type nitrate/sulfonate/bicarbonate transport system substrate-binding protein
MSNGVNRAKFILGAAVVLGVVAAPGPLAGPANAQKRDVSFRLDWLYQGPNSGFMVAKDKGYYDEAGLNVEMGPGRGSGSTSQLVASKAAMIGFADGFVVGAGVAKGMDIVMVAAIYRRNPTAAITLKESGIKSVKELEGKTIGIPPGGTQFQQWPAFVKGCKLDGSKITVANVDPAGAVPALVTGKVQAIASYAQGAVPGIQVRSKKEAEVFWYADCGVTAVSNGIIVHKDLLKSDPDLHDAREPCQFVFRAGGLRLGLLTDTGHATPVIREALSDCDALAIEFNHDRQMLANGSYPEAVKARVGSRFGHLSNDQTVDLVEGVAHDGLNWVIGLHLSEQNNSPELVRRAAARITDRSHVELRLATQNEPSPWLEVARC